MGKPLRLLILLAFAGFGVSASARATTLTRGPYLQLQAPDSIRVVWWTDVNATGEVEWGLTTSYGNLEEALESTTRHEIVITGLTPDTPYHYRVRVDGTPLSADTTFRTAPPSSASAVSFTFVGDSCSAPSNCTATFNAMLPELANGFCVTLGDLAGRGEDNITDYWQLHFFDPAANAVRQICVYPTIGNHELYDETATYVYPTRYLTNWSLPTASSGSEFYYSFDKAHVHFASVDTFWTSYTAGSAQHTWLANDLAGTTQPWKIVFGHDGAYISEDGASHGSTAMRTHLVPLFEQHGVDLYLHGHYHNYQRNVLNGVTYIDQGTGGQPWSTKHPDDIQPYVQAYADQQYSFSRLDIQGSHLLGRCIRTADGVILDGYQIDKPPMEMPWSDEFTAGGPELNWIAPWNFESQCGLTARAGNPSGDGYVFEVADTLGHQYAYPMLADESLHDCNVEAQIYYDGSSPVKNRFGIGVRGRLFFSSSERSYYALVFVDNDTLADDGHCVLMVNQGATETVLATWPYPDASGWHKMRLSVSGNTLLAWIDDELRTTTPVTDSALPKGRPFLYNYRADGSGAKTLADDVVVTFPAAPPSGQYFVDDFESYADGTYAVFRYPGYSGSTWGVEPGNTAAVSSEDANNVLAPDVGLPGTECDKVTWAWTEPGTGYIRLTTSNTANRPNPLLDLGKGLSLYVKLPAGELDVQLQIRETGGSGPIGADGGKTGVIERTANAVRVHAGDCWQYVHFDIPNEPWTAFTGDGVLDGEWGTLESLAISPVAGDPTVSFTLYIDDIYQGPEQAAQIEDCNSNAIPDACDLSESTSQDCNHNTVPDECDLVGGGDFDGSGTVDLTDFLAFGDCLAGPGTTPSPTNLDCIGACLNAFDFEPDGDLDLADFAGFQTVYTGP